MATLPRSLAFRSSAASTSSTTYAYSLHHEYLAISQTVAGLCRLPIYQLTTQSVIYEHIPPQRHLVTSLVWNDALLVIGLSNGLVQLLNVLEGQVQASFDLIHTSAITHCLFHTDPSILFTCSSDGWIVSWDVKKGTMKKKFKTSSGAAPKRMALSKDATYLAVADTSVTLFTDFLSEPKELYSFSSHATDVQCLLFSSQFSVLSSALDDRFIQVHHCTEHSAKILPSLSLPSSVVDISVSAQGHIASVAKDGKLYLWSSNQSVQEKKRMKYASKEADVTLDIKDETSHALLPITSCTFTNEKKIIITWGHGVDPKIETLNVFDEQGVLLPSQTLYRSQKVTCTLTPEPTPQKPEPAQHVVDLGQLPCTNIHSLSFKSFEDQLNAIPSLYEVPSTENNEGSSSNAPVSKTNAKKKTSPHQSVHSAHLNLSQALKSNDNALLESVLKLSKVPKDAQETVTRLPSKYVLPLIYQLLDRLTSSPARGNSLLVWIHATLVAHSGYLLTLPDLGQLLAPLYHHFQTRVQHAFMFQKLMGRVDFILAKRENASSLRLSSDTCRTPTMLTHVQDEDATYEDLSYPTAGTTLRHVFPKASKKTWKKLANDRMLEEASSSSEDETIQDADSSHPEDSMDISPDDQSGDEDSEEVENGHSESDDEDGYNSSESETKVNGLSDSDIDDEDHE